MKKPVSLLLTVFMILPLTVFPVSCANYDYWTFYGGHFASRTGEIYAPKPNAYEISDDGFIYWPYDETGGIYIEHPNPGNPYYHDYHSYAYSTSAFTSNCTLPLEDLTVVISPEEFNFDMDENGRSNMISVLWTEKHISGLASSINVDDYCTGLYHADRVTGGLRNIVRPGNKGLCVTLSNTDPDNIGTMIASDVVITYYDGSYTDENGNNGYSWRFTGSSVMPLSIDGVRDPYENVDLTYGLTVTIKDDKTLGYVVNINGKDYYGDYASYIPDNKQDIDLTGLCDINTGFVTVGAVSTEDPRMPDRKCSYTLNNVNGSNPFTLWDAVPDNHIHSYKVKRTQRGCTVDTIDTYTCDCGDSYIEVLAPYGHSYKQSTVFPTCTEDGYTQNVCSRCGDTEIISTTPAKGHNYKTVAGTGVQVCSRCGHTTNPELPPPHEHSYVEKIFPPACSTEGYTLCKCACGDEYKKNITPATGHIPGEWRDIDENTKVRCCSVCNMPMDSITTFPEPDILGGYTDIKADAWYADSVRFVLKNGYMVGMTGRTFSPNTNLTREQFVVILANMAGVDTDEYKNEQLMSDVKPAYWFAGAVNWAVSEGYVAGVSEGVFGAGQPIQRAALARLLYLYAERNGKETDVLADLSEYSDFSKVQDWMREGLGWAVNHGIITSMKDNELVLAPTATATRAQCARMLTVYDSVPDTELPEPEPEPDVPEPEPDVPDPEPDVPDPEPDVPTPEPDVPTPEPDTDPLGVDEEALKEFLKNGSTETYDEVYFFDLLSISLVYDAGLDIIYAEYGNGRNYPPHFFSYEFGTDKVYIHGPGEFMPPIEYGDDLSLIKPYLKVIETADMTADGIINAPDEYKSELDNMFEELTDMLEILGVLK